MLWLLTLAAPQMAIGMGMATAVDGVPVNESSRAPLEICNTSVPPISGAGVTSIFEPNSPPAREIRNLSYLVFGICIAIFVVVQGFLVVAIVRGVKAARAAARDPVLAAREPVQVYGSGPIEVAWTVVPVIIVFVLTMVTIRTIRDIDTKQPPAGALEIGVIGHQWWWEFRYQAADGSTIVTANELHVPVGRAVALRLNSADVIHSFWVPRLAGKMDLIPGHTNMMWFVAEKPGLYLGQCAEYCGAQHAHMLLRVNADETPAFDQWLAAQAAPASPGAEASFTRSTTGAIGMSNVASSAPTTSRDDELSELPQPSADTARATAAIRRNRTGPSRPVVSPCRRRSCWV